MHEEPIQLGASSSNYGSRIKYCCEKELITRISGKNGFSFWQKKAILKSCLWGFQEHLRDRQLEVGFLIPRDVRWCPPRIVLHLSSEGSCTWKHRENAQNALGEIVCFKIFQVQKWRILDQHQTTSWVRTFILFIFILPPPPLFQPQKDQLNERGGSGPRWEKRRHYATPSSFPIGPRRALSLAKGKP